MLDTYQEALNWIHSRLRLGIKPGLKRMEWMMERLGFPEKKLKTIHVGGTNGKGSTVTFLRHILEEAGYEVGTFTSPYIEQFNERISVNGMAISDSEITELVDVIRPLALELDQTELGGPTEFEVITAMSLYYFANMRPVDIVLYEVGLGGRFDSTNIITPLISIITSIGLDHTAILGETHDEIAFEKAGILKRGIPSVTAVKPEHGLHVIQDMARELQSRLLTIGEQWKLSNHQSVSNGEVFDLSTPWSLMTDVKITMVGKHQTENASLAILTCELLREQYLFSISERQIRSGLKSAFWPGRFEAVSNAPCVILDGAHNEEGVATLVQTLTTRYRGKKKIHIMFAALHDKKVDGMINQLDHIADELIFVDFTYPRAAPKEALYQLSQNHHKGMAEDWRVEMKRRVDTMNPNEILIVTGSLYFISEVRAYMSEIS